MLHFFNATSSHTLIWKEAPARAPEASAALPGIKEIVHTVSDGMKIAVLVAKESEMLLELKGHLLDALAGRDVSDSVIKLFINRLDDIKKVIPFLPKNLQENANITVRLFETSLAIKSKFEKGDVLGALKDLPAAAKDFNILVNKLPPPLRSKIIQHVKGFIRDRIEDYVKTLPKWSQGMARSGANNTLNQLIPD